MKRITSWLANLAAVMAFVVCMIYLLAAVVLPDVH